MNMKFIASDVHELKYEIVNYLRSVERSYKDALDRSNNRSNNTILASKYLLAGNLAGIIDRAEIVSEDNYD